MEEEERSVDRKEIRAISPQNRSFYGTWISFGQKNTYRARVTVL
jgi:hypothetical protein